jgi:membrane associated rhomboid family serine protease
MTGMPDDPRATTEPAPPPAPPSAMGDAALDALVSRRGPVTTALLAVIIAVSAAALLQPGAGLLDAFAKVNERIRAGEIWRLVTPALVHGGPVHLLVNAMALAQIGRVAEALYGPVRFLFLFVLGTAAATATSFVFTPAPSVGASGGLFAIVGALLAFGVRHRGTLPEAARRRMVRGELFTVAINVALGLTVPYVDNAAHMGGLVAGFVLGLLLPPGRAVAARLRELERERGTLLVR